LIGRLRRRSTSALGLHGRTEYEPATDLREYSARRALGRRRLAAKVEWRTSVAKVIASSVRKGNVLEIDGKLCVVMKAENIHPGKGTPVTHLEMRRISDGVKVTERYRTTEQVERAYLEEKELSYLYEDDTGYTFMNPETFDQIHVPKDILGDQAVYLQDGMTCTVSLYEDNPVAIELPQRVALEVVEADPVVKGQTAASSYKPAVLANGLRIMVPPHIERGTRVVVMTADGSYVERAKD
jgi:elongation factor P